ncbi:DUF2637 domain-containing protein [Streptomyces sp. NBC_01481]|uniref:DUF2637 domain-containing protein n=1 Tax=Streptomyces sp. NBC_01481 TaxID=2975869 RepID=UPI00224DA068|nr:DUF2637 domain-containing protein [Streptomyces sp. NBC_01481]MCX4587053.1 DUF2637 domain-containing protein [Streptomyces sp. NBC_01481]
MSTATETRPAVPPLTQPELWLLGAVAVLAAGVGGLGLASSFEAVSTAGARWGFASPWMLPVGIDVAIPVFTAAFLLLIRTDMPLGWVRFVPWALTGVTCWLNVAAGHSLSAKLAHGTMPLLWVVLSEVAAHVYAARIGAVTGRRMEKIRRARWLLAPLSTFALWRRMTLWEVTSYSDALGRERERQLARAELRERHGRRWRSKTPRPERVLLKLGELSPASEEQPPVGPKVPKPPVPPNDETPEPRRRTRKPPTAKPQRTPAELLAEAREATADWADDAINAEAIRTTLHCSAANSRILRDALLSERANGRRLHPVEGDESDEAVA